MAFSSDGCSVIPSGFPRAASGFPNAAGKGERTRTAKSPFFCSAHRLQAIYASFRLVARLACCSALNKLSTWQPVCQG